MLRQMLSEILERLKKGDCYFSNVIGIILIVLLTSLNYAFYLAVHS